MSLTHSLTLSWPLSLTEQVWLQIGKLSQQTGKFPQQSGKISQQTGKVSQQSGKVSQHLFAVKWQVTIYFKYKLETWFEFRNTRTKLKLKSGNWKHNLKLERKLDRLNVSNWCFESEIMFPS